MANSVPITALTAEAVYGAINITITATTNPCLPYLQVASYQIWASATNDRTAATQVGTSTVPFWAHTAATPGTQYWYWAKTVDGSGAVGDFYPATTTSTVTATAKTSAGLTLTLSASAIVVPADASGTVTSFSGAASTAKVLDGVTDVTASWSFSASATGVTVSQSTATFTVTAMASSNGFFDITGTRAGYPNLVARATVAKSQTGATGAAGASAPALRLSATSQVFQVTAAGANSPASIDFTASLLGGLSGTPTFSVTAGTATLTGSGTTRNLTYANLSTDTATIQATLSGSSDSITVAKIREGATGATGSAGVNAVVALLSNEAHTLQADAAGTVGSFSGAASTITIYEGITDTSASWTVTKADTGVTSTLATRTVTITAMSADSGYVDITAARSGYTSIVKRFSLTKSKQGVTGTTGATGTRGSMTFYVSGQSSWSDSAANTAAGAAPNGKQLNDVVTEYNSTNFSQTKYWNGTSWVTITQTIDGNLLVTGSVGTTQISASYVYAGTITATQITAGTFTGHTFRTASSGQRVELSGAAVGGDNYLRFYNASGGLQASMGGASQGILQSYIQSSDTLPGIYVSSSHATLPAANFVASFGAPAVKAEVITTGGSPAVHATATAGSGSVVFGQTSSTASGVAGWFEVSNTAGGHGLRGLNNATTGGIVGGSGIMGITGSAGGYAVYAERGAYGPFTGAHDGIMSKTAVIEAGDIVVDVRVVASPTINDSITEVARSSSPAQRTAVGVYVSRRAMTDDNTPVGLSEWVETVDTRGGKSTKPKRAAAHEALVPAYDLVVINSVGEGLINVCAEGGNITAGDLIITSSKPGKGMKQDDDVLRAGTVARARESVIFKNTADVRQIACIYLCG